MTLIEAPDKPGVLYHRLISEDGTIEMGIRPVIYGFRINAGYTDLMGFELDWCAGGNIEMIKALYGICRSILQKRESDMGFKGIPPVSKFKPYYKDKDFFEIITKMAVPGVVDVPHLTPSSLLAIRENYMSAN